MPESSSCSRLVSPLSDDPNGALDATEEIGKGGQKTTAKDRQLNLR